MTLRAQIRHAIDDVAPPAPTLERRVRQLLLAESETKPRPRPRWTGRLRAPLGLVAVALVIALVAGLFIGGRFWRTLNAPPSTVGTNELKALEDRPLNFPSVAPGAACPVSPRTLGQYGMFIGDPGDPVGVYDTEVYESTAWGEWIEIAIGYSPVYGAANPGLILVRARDLQSSAEVVFAKYPLAPTGVSAVGPVVGQEHALNHDLTLRAEAAFRDAAHTTPIDKQGHLPENLVVIGLQKGSSGCIGLQFDGPGGHENLVLGLGGP